VEKNSATSCLYTKFLKPGNIAAKAKKHSVVLLLQRNVEKVERRAIIVIINQQSTNVNNFKVL